MVMFMVFPMGFMCFSRFATQHAAKSHVPSGSGPSSTPGGGRHAAAQAAGRPAHPATGRRQGVDVPTMPRRASPWPGAAEVAAELGEGPRGAAEALRLGARRAHCAARREDGGAPGGAGKGGEHGRQWFFSLCHATPYGT